MFIEKYISEQGATIVLESLERATNHKSLRTTALDLFLFGFIIWENKEAWQT